MKSSTLTPLVSDLVLIGGGHAHVHILKMLGMPPLKETLLQNGIQVTLITQDVQTPYSGMLPGMVAGHYTHDEIHLDLRVLCSFSGIRLVHCAATGVEYDRSHKGGSGGWVHCSDGRPPIRYDALSIDVGSSPALPEDRKGQESQNLHLDGQSLVSRVTPVKPISGFSVRWNYVCERLRRDFDDFNSERPFVLVVVGAGAGGIELTLSAQYALQNIMKELSSNYQEGSIKVILATRGSNLLESHNPRVQQIFIRILKKRNVEVRFNAEAVGVLEESLEEKASIDGTFVGIKSLILSKSSKEQPPIQFHECLWCTSAGAAPWLSQNTPFSTTEEGFLKVRNTYECVDHPGVFAAGDCCHMVDNPRPKAGVFAVRAGPPLKDNLIAYLTKKKLTVHEPQTEFLGLISTGNKYAVASRGCFALEGAFLWTLKDRIDRTWMEGYQRLPSMEEGDDDKNLINSVPPYLTSRGADALAAFSAAPMRCGGCGAKVGARTVSRVLDAVHQRRMLKAEALTAMKHACNVKPKKIDHDDAAVVMLPEQGGGAMIHTIDFFRSFISDPFVFGKIAAVHALSDCHAMGAQAQTALALAVVPFAAFESITECTLVDMLSGASDILDDDGCELSGGHTCEGAELALGFAINGYIQNPKYLFRKQGGRVGDKMILTKPIGTGALFAADMRAKCPGKFVEEAIGSMVTSNSSASRIAMNLNLERDSDCGCIHACTDVTGFGLVGHLLEMLVANDGNSNLDQISATLDLCAVPFFEGALEAVSKDIVSSLQRENARSRRAIRNHEEAAKECPEKYRLIFDPQTAGGLLFFVSPDVVDEFVSKLSSDPGTKCAVIIGELNKYKGEDNIESCDEENICIVGACSNSTSSRIHIKY